MSDALLRMVRELSPERRRMLLELVRGDSDPLAIVGVACRFPGADSPESFWELLAAGGDAVTEVPPTRWDADAHYSPEPGEPGRTNSRWGGFVGDVDRFDAAFFGISPREAIAIDPQQRLVLETAWDALERAGQTRESLAGSSTGVFVGIGACEYSWVRPRDPELLDAYAGTGISNNVAAGRLSHFLDLRGPSIAVDTACSSSLVAVHLAARSVRDGESDMAIAAGVNVVLLPWLGIVAAQMGATAPDGRCKAFDARADGYVRGEGCGVVVLRRLADALADGDPVLALLRGSAVNQDGRSGALTAPSPAAQEELIRRALRDAGVTAEEVGLVEAHGTGTELGDPVELEALHRVLGDGGGRCFVGSVKANVGHLEAAAGIAGLIKAVLAVQRGAIPPLVHFREPTPHVDLDGSRIAFPTELEDWPSAGAARVAGVSSFGWSGTNAHVVVGEAPPAQPRPVPDADAPQLLPISARSPHALQVLAGRYADLLDAGEPALPDIAYTAALRRTHHDHRLAVAGTTRAELASALRASAPRGRRAPRPPRVAFVFSGHGSQWVGMARDLIAAEPVFADAIDRCERALAEHADWSLGAELAAEPGASRLDRRDRVDVTQPAIFAVQVALAELWRSWGVEPAAVVGHSLGEVAAACVAGALTLEDAARTICVRSRLIESVSGSGAMALVEAPAADVERALAGLEDRVAVAVVSSPRSAVVSGEAGAVDALLARLEGEGVEAHRMKVVGATHCPQIEAIVPRLVSELESLRPRAPRVPLYSTVTGAPIGDASLDASYWARNVRRTVRFADAVAALLADGHDALVEVSPHPVLLGALRECASAAGAEPVLVGSLARGRDARATLLASLGELYELGQQVDWGALHPHGGTTVALPAYPFERARYWMDGGGERSPDPAPAPAREELVLATVWREAAASATANGAAPAPWVLLVDAGGVGDLLADRLGARGERCVRVRVGRAATASGDGAYVVPPGGLADLLGDLGAPGARVVHLWSLDARPADGDGEPDWVELAEHAAVTSVAELARALPAGAAAWLVTRGGESAAPGALGGAVLAGTCRAARLERPDVRWTHVDLDAAGDAADAAAALAGELRRPAGEPDVALRTDARRVRRLVRLPAVAAAPPPPVAGGAYLVTGGLGGVGLATAEWLARRGARHVALVARRAPDAAARAAAERVERLGASVRLVRADVADRDGAARAIADAEAAAGEALRGVVHAAAVLEDGLLADVTPERVRAVLAPKVAGAWNLHALTRDLDLFVLFSSLASVLGSPAQGAYSAANAFLDALARERRARGLAALSVSWGPWADVGVAAERDGWTERLARFGVRPLPPARALAALERALAGAEAHVAILDGDPDALLRAPVIGASPLLSELAPDARAPRPHASSLAAELALAPPDRRRAVARERLLEGVAELLRARAGELDAAAPLAELGMDSLAAVELRVRVETELGVRLPLAALRDSPSVDSLAEHVAAALGGAPARVAGAVS